MITEIRSVFPISNASYCAIDHSLTPLVLQAFLLSHNNDARVKQNCAIVIHRYTLNKSKPATKFDRTLIRFCPNLPTLNALWTVIQQEADRYTEDALTRLRAIWEQKNLKLAHRLF